jgi:alkyl hydroperoxide reductase subunit AhpC
VVFPKTVHRFVTANAAALGALSDGLLRVVDWVEFCPEGEAGLASPIAWPTGSPTAEGRAPHAMKRRKTALL